MAMVCLMSKVSSDDMHLLPSLTGESIKNSARSFFIVIAIRRRPADSFRQAQVYIALPCETLNKRESAQAGIAWREASRASRASHRRFSTTSAVASTRSNATLLRNMTSKVVVVAPIDFPPPASSDASNGSSNNDNRGNKNENFDAFNRPRQRRLFIAQALQAYDKVDFVVADSAEADLSMYEGAHSQGLLDFLLTSWSKWENLGKDGRDPLGSLETKGSDIPALIPGNFCIPREPNQLPSKHVIGQIGYYCNDTCTPVFADLKQELIRDADCLRASTKALEVPGAIVYMLPTHPGHHAASDSYGGYCYVNHVAAAVEKRQEALKKSTDSPRIAILDVDYHAGNGTASIFYENPNVFVVSIHCDPDYEYPFHTGFSHQTGEGAGKGMTLHVPLAPQTGWPEYEAALRNACQKIHEFDPSELFISLGLDTYQGDPCAIRRAGFCLQGDDYTNMGRVVAEVVKASRPSMSTLIVQEGGYRMDTVGEAAAKMVMGYASYSE
jgi:acetoin utilization deacetylase AcuC-like enzyme